MKSACSQSRRTQAFTLLEVLIASVAFAIVLASINAVFYGAVRLRNKAVDSFDQAVPMQHALAILKRDLANIVAPGGTLSGTLQTTPNTGQSGQSASALLSQTTAGLPGQSSPAFYTATGIIDETTPWAEVQKVSYFLTASTNGSFGKDLFRSVTRNLLPSLVDQPVQQPLLSGVQTINFLFYDGTQWRDTWDSTTEQTKLPRAVKVQIGMAAEEKNRLAPPPIELVVPLLVDGGTNSTSQATGGQQ
jgi:type II secretion system protein J